MAKVQRFLFNTKDYNTPEHQQHRVVKIDPFMLPTGANATSTAEVCCPCGSTQKTVSGCNEAHARAEQWGRGLCDS